MVKVVMPELKDCVAVFFYYALNPTKFVPPERLFGKSVRRRARGIFGPAADDF